VNDSRTLYGTMEDVRWALECNTRLRMEPDVLTVGKYWTAEDVQWAQCNLILDCGGSPVG
jgi:hypothetical protein